MTTAQRRLCAAVAVLFFAIAASVALAGQTRGLPTARRSTNVPNGPLVPQAAVTPFAASSVAPRAQLPPIPPPPAGSPSQWRKIRSANGTYITFSYVSGCGGSQGASLVLNCVISATVTKGPGVTGTEAGYVLAPGTTTPTAYTFGSNVTLNANGYWVIGAFDTTTNAWDGLLYLSVGNTGAVVAYDASGNVIATITANGSNRVQFVATGLTTGDSYVVGAESTSVTGQCAWLTNSSAIPTATPTGSLCNPTTATSSIPATGGQISAAWIPPATTGGTMTISVWDVTTPASPVRVAQTQITVIATQFVPATGQPAQTMPSWQFSSNNFTSTASPPIFAFYNALDATGGGASIQNIYARIGRLPGESGDSYTVTMTDPSGNPISQATATGTDPGSGTYLNPNPYNFGLANYIGAAIGQSSTITAFGYQNTTLSLGLLDRTAPRANLLAAASAFKVVGFSAQEQWQPASGGGLTNTIIAAGGSTSTGQIVLTNNGDTVFGPGNSDALTGFRISLTDGPPALFDVNIGGLHSGSFADAGGNTWNYTIAQTSPGWVITITATGGASLAPNAVLTTPTISIFNKNNSCNSSCPLTTQLTPQHGTGNWSLDPLSNNVNPVNQMAIENTARPNGQSYAEIVHYGYVLASSPATITTNAGAHRYSFAGRTLHQMYQLPPLGQTATGYDDVYELTLVSNNNGDGKDFQVQMPAGFDATNVLQSSQLGNIGNVFTAQRCTSAPAANYICFGGGNYAAGSTPIHVYFALPPPTQTFSYQDVVVQLNTASGYQSSGGVSVLPWNTPAASTAVYDDQYVASVDALALAGYSLDNTTVSTIVSPSTVGQNKTAYPITFQVTNGNTSLGNYPDYIDQIVVDVADQGGQTLTSAGTSTPAGWTMQGTTTTGAGGTRRYWFSVCPTEVAPNDAYGPTAAAGNGSSVSVPACSTTAGWKAATLAPATNVQYPLSLRTLTANIPMTVYVHGANGGGWSKGIPFTINVSAASATSGFSAAGTYGSPATVGSGTEPTIGLKSNATYGDSFLYQITNNGSANVTSFAMTMPGKDVSGNNAFDGTYSWQFTGAPTLQPAPGDTSTYGCTLTTPAGASGSYVSATSTGNDGHVFVNGCALPPGKSVVLAFTALYPQTINETYRFPVLFNWTAYNSGTNTTDGVAAGEQWYSDQLINVTTSTSLIVYVPNPGTTTYPALTPADTASPATSMAACGGCQFLNSPNTIDFGTVLNGQSKSVTDGVLVRVINANAPNGWKLYVDTNYNNPYSGGGQELQTAFDITDSTTGKNLQATQGGTSTTYYDIPTTSPGLSLVNNGNVSAVQTPYDMMMSMQVRVGSETQPSPSAVATVTYTWIAN